MCHWCRTQWKCIFLNNNNMFHILNDNIILREMLNGEIYICGKYWCIKIDVFIRKKICFLHLHKFPSAKWHRNPCFSRHDIFSHIFFLVRLIYFSHRLISIPTRQLTDIISRFSLLRSNVYIQELRHIEKKILWKVLRVHGSTLFFAILNIPCCIILHVNHRT